MGLCNPKTFTLALTVLVALLCALASANGDTISSAQHLRREYREARAQPNFASDSSPLQSTFELPQHAGPLTQTPIVCPTTSSFSLDLSFKNYTDAQAQEVLINYAYECRTQFQQLTIFRLYLNNNPGLTSINCVSYAIRIMRNLKSLYLGLNNNQIDSAGLTDVQNMFEYNPLLQSLAILLSNNQITDLNAFKNTFRSLPILAQLELQFQNNQITDVEFASTAFYTLQELEELTLYLNGNNITSVAPLANSFDNLQKLQSIYLKLYDNLISSVEFVQTAFQNLHSLKNFRLDLNENQIVDVSPFASALANNTALQSFTLWLNQNRITEGIDELIDGIQVDVGDRKAFCPFYFNINDNPLTDAQKKQLKALKTNLQSIYSKVTCRERNFAFFY